MKSIEQPIQENSNDVSIIIYDSPYPPRYFKITKNFVKIVFFVVPILFVSALVSMFFWGLSDRLQNTNPPEVPSFITNSANKIDVLKKEIKLLKDSNHLLSLKLSQVPSVSEVGDPFLSVIKKPYGMQVFTKENRVKIGSLQFEKSMDSIGIKFNVLNNFSAKVSGHILVFLVSEDGLVGYPAKINQYFIEGVRFNLGETFSVSRLRPTYANFLNFPQEGQVKFVIYIFNRDGDLLQIEEAGPYKLGSTK